ncbi:MAG: hypothetical protein EA358_07660 [Flavobacteriales bacterium]|nr:MAG: hypothetical protein EA358_07660 [Flavobacteriales bacterium]
MNTDSSLYFIFQKAHSGLAYAVLGILVFVLIFFTIQVNRGSDYGKREKLLATITVALAHLQLLTGLVLYIWLSPKTQAAFADWSETMKTPDLRLMAIEHITTNILGVIAITMGSVKAKKQTVHKYKYKKAMLLFAIGLVLFLSRIPWKVWLGMV